MRLIDNVHMLLEAEDKTPEQKAVSLHGMLEFACLTGDVLAQGACLLALWINAAKIVKLAPVVPDDLTRPWTKHLTKEEP